MKCSLLGYADRKRCRWFFPGLSSSHAKRALGSNCCLFSIPVLEFSPSQLVLRERMKKLTQRAHALCMLLKNSSREPSYPTWQMAFTSAQFSKWRKTNAQDTRQSRLRWKEAAVPTRTKYIQFVISILLLIYLPILVFSKLKFSGHFRHYWRKGMKLVKPASSVSSWETDISFHFCPYHLFTLNISNYSALCKPQLTKCPNCSHIRYLHSTLRPGNAFPEVKDDLPCISLQMFIPNTWSWFLGLPLWPVLTKVFCHAGCTLTFQKACDTHEKTDKDRQKASVQGF